MWRVVVVLAVVVGMGGCASVERSAARGVAGYCATLSLAEREVLRERINTSIAPNSLLITCATDGEGGVE